MFSHQVLLHHHYWFTVGFALHLVWLCGKLDHYHLVVSVSSNNQGSILYHCCCYHYVVITIVVMITFFLWMNILLPYYYHIMLLHDIFSSIISCPVFSVIALDNSQFSVDFPHGKSQPWFFGVHRGRPSVRKTVPIFYIYIYVPVWFSTDFPIFSPYFSIFFHILRHQFPVSTTSIGHPLRLPFLRWCPRSFWRTAWSLANVRRGLGKMMLLKLRKHI